MKRVIGLLLHRAWLPAVALVTLVALAPRVGAALTDKRLNGRATGVFAWEQATEASPFGETAFRWTKGRAAVMEPIRGRVLALPVYLARPDIGSREIHLRVTIDGVPTPRATLATNGWHVLKYDLVNLMGQERLTTMRTVTLSLVVSPTVTPAEVSGSDDHRQLGVGIGGVRWEGPAHTSSPDARRP